MTSVSQPESTHEARRAQRQAAATALLATPPPLDGLRVNRVLRAQGDVLHASRSRPVVRWDLVVETDGGAVSRLPVVGKGFVKGDGEQARRLLHQLRANGFADPPLQVPQPYGFDPTRRLLAQEEAPAGTLYGLLQDELEAAVPSVRRVAAWLAQLHRTTGVDVLPLPAAFEHEKLDEYAAALAKKLPWAAGRVLDLTAATEQRLREATAGPRRVTHGDFQPKNVHLDGHRVMVIDFDRAALAPAARDLGHFVGQTLTMAAALHGHLDAGSAWVSAFVDAYAAAGGDPRAVEAMPGYAARTFAEVLYYRLVIRPVGTYAFVPAWLAAWESQLTGGTRR